MTRLILSVDSVTKLPPAPTVAAIVATITSLGGYTHTQVSASATWIITHNLGHLPDVTIYGTDGSVIGADAVSTTTLTTISFGFPVAGSARLS